jgi:hypothetical protein
MSEPDSPLPCDEETTSLFLVDDDIAVFDTRAAATVASRAV